MLKKLSIANNICINARELGHAMYCNKNNTSNFNLIPYNFLLPKYTDYSCVSDISTDTIYTIMYYTDIMYTFICSLEFTLCGLFLNVLY